MHAGSSFASQFLTKIIDNVQISLYNVHVMVESGDLYPNVCQPHLTNFYFVKLLFISFH